MRVTVTGATSFIGRALVNELLAGGHEVFAVVRPASERLSELKRHERLKIIECGLEDIEGLKRISMLKGCDVWYHLAWGGSGSGARGQVQLQSHNARYALNSLTTAAALGCRKFIFSGSQAEYGIRNSLMRESDECSPVSEYGRAKLLVLKEALAAAGRLGIDYVHARIFSIYGVGDHPWTLTESCVNAFSKGEGIELGACTQLWNFLYITDAARALVLLAGEAVSSGIYNIAGEDTRALKDYVEEIKDICGGGHTEFGVRPPNAEGDTALIPDISKLKGLGFTQKVSFRQGIELMLKARGK